MPRILYRRTFPVWFMVGFYSIVWCARSASHLCEPSLLAWFLSRDWRLKLGFLCLAFYSQWNNAAMPGFKEQLMIPDEKDCLWEHCNAKRVSNSPTALHCCVQQDFLPSRAVVLCAACCIRRIRRWQTKHKNIKWTDNINEGKPVVAWLRVTGLIA